MAAFALVVSCSGGDVRPDAVRITGIDYRFVIDNAVRAGLARITFANDGADFHMLAIRRLAGGKTFRDLDLALGNDDPADDETPFAPGDTVDGAPSVLTPGASTRTYASLSPGTYGLVCYFPAADGVPHYQKGMLASLVVLGRSGDAPSPPDADGEIATTAAKLTLPDLSPGKGTFRYVNRDGAASHGLTFVRLHDGKALADFVTWLDGYFQGIASFDDRPADIWGGLEAVRTSAYLTLDLPPGRYLALDTESAGAEGREFFRDEYGGLRAEFTVR